MALFHNKTTAVTEGDVRAILNVVSPQLTSERVYVKFAKAVVHHAAPSNANACANSVHLLHCVRVLHTALSIHIRSVAAVEIAMQAFATCTEEISREDRPVHRSDCAAYLRENALSAITDAMLAHSTSVAIASWTMVVFYHVIVKFTLGNDGNPENPATWKLLRSLVPRLHACYQQACEMELKHGAKLKYPPNAFLCYSLPPSVGGLNSKMEPNARDD